MTDSAELGRAEDLIVESLADGEYQMLGRNGEPEAWFSREELARHIVQVLADAALLIDGSDA